MKKGRVVVCGRKKIVIDGTQEERRTGDVPGRRYASFDRGIHGILGAELLNFPPGLCKV
jgi:hypothetical protein